MTWRGSVDTMGRIFSVLVYLIAWADAVQFGVFLFQKLPITSFFFLPALPVVLIYSFLNPLLFGFGSFLVFLLLFFAVVRNPQVSYFIRFNAMQTILIGILLSLIGLVTNTFLQPVLAGGILLETLYNVAFLGGIGACLYCMFQSAFGRYAEIPTISQAAYSQLPY